MKHNTPGPPTPRLRLGEVLLVHGLVTPDQLNRALAIHKATGERVGRVLVDMGVVDDEAIAAALSEQLGVELARLTGPPPADEILALLPATLISRLQAVPVARRNGALTVAMVDPIDVVAVDAIRQFTGLDVQVAVTTAGDVRHVLTRAPGAEAGVARDLPRRPVLEPNGAKTQAAPRAEDEAPNVRLVNRLIEEAVRERASDIHIERHERHIRIRYRVDGVLRTRGTLPEHVHAQVVSRIKIMASMDIAERRVPQDGSFQARVDGNPIDVRVSTIPAFYGEKVVLRLLDTSASVHDLDTLGLTPPNLARLLRIVQRPQGIFLLTGPTGSGKTTTLYAILNRLNREQVNILTVEDPVEYQVPGITQMPVNPKAGVTFASALRHFLRQDPDIIMVGEVRDQETARIAIQAALTGHLVLSTLHTNDAAGAITRLLDMGIEPYLVASALAGLAAQRLVRVLCPKCREPDPPPPQAAAPGFSRGRGCDACAYTGYRGRTAIFEVAQIDDHLRPLIIQRAPHHVLRDQAVASGMTPLHEDGLQKAAAGVTSLAEVERVVHVEHLAGHGPAETHPTMVPAASS